MPTHARLVCAIAIGFIAACGTSRHRHTPAPVSVTVETPAAMSPAAVPPATAASEAPAPAFLYPSLGRHTRSIRTQSADAQRCFDQALTLTFAFNHDEAIRLYGEAAKLEPKSPMPWWGIALANGPHYNNPAMPPERSRAAWAALEQARARLAAATPVERSLIDALGKRYSADEKAERRPMDEAYAAAMRECWKKHPDDADVGTLFAESMMNLRPWDLWGIDGTSKPGTEEIVATLDAVLARWPDHPGVNHLYIHAIEASPHPERGVAAADRLGPMVPDAGHLVHMPAHIYVRVGRYADASRSNVLAMEADRRNDARFPRAGFYRIYMAHNPHFLAFSSMMEGRRAAALEAARKTVAGMPREFLETQAPLADGFLHVVLHAMVRFGLWDDVLKEPAFDQSFTASNAVRHYARGIALTALGRLDEAAKEQQALEEAVKRVDAARTIGNNNAGNVLRVPVKMLAAELLFRQGKHDESFAAFREAIAFEDQLLYGEPPDWMQPVRHAFGASLLAAKKYEEAERVFLEDLRRFPENGWSLTGLGKSLRARGAPEAEAVEKRRAKAFARADVEVKSPCFCQPGN